MQNVFYKVILMTGILSALLSCGESAEQTRLWQIAEPVEARGLSHPHKQAYFSNNAVALHRLLENAPSESSGDNSYLIELPLPDGTQARFNIVESPVMEAELAAQYPELKTYKVLGLDDPGASGRIDISPKGLRAMLYTAQGRVTIDPSGDLYRVQSRSGGESGAPFQCDTTELESRLTANPTTANRATANRSIAMRVSNNLLVYRLALAATQEYVSAVGGTLDSAMAEINTAVNRVNEIYERDLGIRLVLVANNNLLIDVNGSSPLAGFNNDGLSLLSKNQLWVDATIGSANYDIGHVLSTGGGGIAQLASVCFSPTKAQGVTGLSNPTGDSFYIDFVAHEIGHQFNAGHSFNGTTASCNSGRVTGSAFEPGSGSTIMAYAGICGTENLQSNSDAVFHSESIAQIHAFTNSSFGNCSTLLPLNNANEPVVNAGVDHTIPVGTAFILTGTGSDNDGDTLSYQWDQINLGTLTTAANLGTDLGDNPLFRSFEPQAMASRDFPALGTQLGTQRDLSETLPCTSRNLNFRLTARDGKSGQASDTVQLIVDNTAGPFKITSHTTTETILSSDGALLSWNVANTNNANINCTNVDIDLLTFSSVGHSSYSVTSLLTGTPNDGSQFVNIPDMANSNARFRVKCSNNVFYDISDADLVIQGSGVFPTTDQSTFFNSNGSTFATPTSECVAVIGTDTIAPVVTAPANIMVAATNADGTASSDASITAFLNAATALDAVDGSRPVSNNAPLTFPLGATVVTFTASDLSGNTGQAQATVTVADQSPPVITLIGASAITLNVGDVFSDPGSTVSDNVSTGLVATVTGSVNTNIVGLYTLTYNVSDTAGNSAATVTRSISVQDSNAPVVTPPSSITVAATDASGTASTDTSITSFLNAATANDAVDGSRPVSNNAPLTFPLGATVVTFTASDLSGNSGQAQATVTVTDQSPPVITLIGASAITLNVGDVFSDPGSTVSDNVSTGLVATVTGTVNTATLGSYSLKYNANDSAGNSAVEVTRTIEVVDKIAPVITPPDSITVAATDASGTANSDADIATFLNAATALDAVDGSRPVSNNAPLTFPLGATVVTFTASDLSGNSGQAQATVTVTDQSPPVITLIGASAITLNVGDVFSDPGSTVSDNVSTGLSATVTGSVNTNIVGLYTLTYNVSDTAGNSAATVTRSISVQDSNAPVVTPPSSITVAATDASGTASSDIDITAFLNAATAIDTVDGSRPVSNNAPLTFPLGATVVTFTATDLSGNTGQAQATVTVTDLSPPVISLIGSSSITLSIGDVFSDPGSTVSDNVSTGLSATVTGSVNSNTVGLYTLTYNVSDTAGNPAATVTRSISVQDSNAPVVTPPSSISVAATDASGTASSDIDITAFLNAATAIDTVDGSRPVSNNAPLTFPLGATVVTFTATDLSGNTGQAQATVTVTDLSPPVISLIGSSSITLSIGDVFSDPGSTVSDNVSTGLVATVTGNVNTNIVGLYTLTYNVSDTAGNSAATVTRSISVQDSNAPVVTPPSSISVAATDASGTASTDTSITSFLNAATANDAVDGSRPVSNNAPAIFPLGATIVTFTASDLSGNSGQAQATVTVTDQSSPVITLIGGSSITLSVGDVFSDPGSTVSDNVSTGLVATVTGSVNTNIVGLYTLTYNVSDTAGNSAATVTRSISVQDSNAPVVTPPSSITVAATDASGTASTDTSITSFLNAATANDAVDGSRPVSNNAPLTFPLGATVVTFTATDLSGNTGQAQATVTVTDLSPPVISLIGSSSITLNVGDVFSDPGSTVSDNVSTGLIATVTGSVNTNIVGLYTLTYNVSDTAGNPAATVTRSISVQDSNAPVVTPPSSITVAATDASGTASSDIDITAFLNAATALDAVDGSRPVSNNAPLTFPLGATVVTFTASDLSGNTGQAQATVTVTDQSPPVITLIGASAITLNIGDVFSDPGSTVSDNVSTGLVATVTGNVNSNIAGLYTLTYNVSDSAGNVASPVIRSVNVSIRENAAPVITAPADLIIPSIGAVTPVQFEVVEAIDDKDGVILASPDKSGPFVPGLHAIQWSASDSSGKTGFAYQFVDVLPLVEFIPEQLSEPEVLLSIPVKLNGFAASYPVQVDFNVFENSSSVPSDSGSIFITEGIEGSIDYKMPDAGEVRFEITTVTNAIKGPMASHMVSIIKQNVAPLSQLMTKQNEQATSVIAKDAGAVTVSAIVHDANSSDSHTFDWSKTDNALLTSSPGLSDAQFSFDPSGLLPGLYKINVKVSDNGTPPLAVEVQAYMQVMNTAIVLTETDTDQDGISDIDEGYGDDDGDAIPNYLDPVDNPALMQTKPGVSDKWLLNVQPGLNIRLGKVSLAAQHQSASVSENDIRQIAGALDAVVVADQTDSFTNVGGYFDFEINGLGRSGQSALVVLPQFSPIPADAVYRKYSESGGWRTFVEDNNNTLSSAAGEEGICPPPGDSAYQHQDGLVEGHYCVQLLIADGGPNDADNLENGVIADPGGIAIASVNNPDPVTPTPAPTNNSSGDSGGGAIDLLTLILLLSIFQLRYKKPES